MDLVLKKSSRQGANYGTGFKKIISPVKLLLNENSWGGLNPPGLV
jgi:hypothetical protein